MTSNVSTLALPTLSESEVKDLKSDAANARQEGRLDTSTAPTWDGIVARYGNGKPAKGDLTMPKRSAILRAVLEASGEWKDSPQVDADKVRTPFGNVVQRFGARFDAAVKRANPVAATDTDYLARIIAAVDNGVTHNLSASDILAAVQSHVDGLLS